MTCPNCKYAQIEQTTYNKWIHIFVSNSKTLAMFVSFCPVCGILLLADKQQEKQNELELVR